MDNLEKLYNVLKRDGFITKSFDEFVDQATQDSDYQDKIFNVVSRENLFTGSPDEFSKKYFSELATSPVEEVKKKRRFSTYWGRGSYGIRYRSGGRAWIIGAFCSDKF